MMIPGVITVISFIQLYGESGILTKAIQYALHLEKIPYEFQGLGAIVFVITYTQYVYFYLNVYVALKYVDNSGIEAARSMGASWWKIFRDVIWPVYHTGGAVVCDCHICIGNQCIFCSEFNWWRDIRC